MHQMVVRFLLMTALGDLLTGGPDLLLYLVSLVESVSKVPMF